MIVCISLNCWKLLKLYRLQRKDEISLSVIRLENDTDIWATSSEALMRGTSRDYMGTSVWYSSGEHLYKWDTDEDIVRSIRKASSGCLSTPGMQ